MVDSRLSFSWNVLPQEDGDRLHPLYPSRTNANETLKRMALRIAGKRDAWEATPRLAGVTGSLPEFLAVEE
jgi:hypothetical protein